MNFQKNVNLLFINYLTWGLLLSPLKLFGGPPVYSIGNSSSQTEAASICFDCFGKVLDFPLSPLAIPPGDAKAWPVSRFDPPSSDLQLTKDIYGPLKAIGRVYEEESGQAWQGTAFFVSECYVMTNAHVVMSGDQNKEAREKVRQYINGEKDPLSGKKVDDVFFSKWAKGLKDKINQDLTGTPPQKKEKLYVVRDKDGHLDKSKALGFEKIVYFDPGADVALVRVSQCLGVKEQQGKIDILDRKKLNEITRDSDFSKVPAVLAGYAGDRSADILSVNTCLGLDAKEDGTLDHKCNTVGGQSGAPIITLTYTDELGQKRFIEKKQLSNAKIMENATPFLIAINKSEVEDKENVPIINKGILISTSKIMMSSIADDIKQFPYEERVARARREGAQNPQLATQPPSLSPTTYSAPAPKVSSPGQGI